MLVHEQLLVSIQQEGMRVLLKRFFQWARSTKNFITSLSAFFTL